MFTHETRHSTVSVPPHLRLWEVEQAERSTDRGPLNSAAFGGSRFYAHTTTYDRAYNNTCAERRDTPTGAFP